MRRKLVTIGIILSLVIYTGTIVNAGEVYFSGYMYGSGRQHIIYENRSTAVTIEKFANSFLGKATGGYIIVKALKEAALLPSIVVHGWKMNARKVKMMDAQIERYKMETKFLYQFVDENKIGAVDNMEKWQAEARRDLEKANKLLKWQQTPRGKQFLTNLSTQLHRPPSTPVYYFDTGN